LITAGRLAGVFGVEAVSSISVAGYQRLDIRRPLIGVSTVLKLTLRVGVRPRAS
jgi:hypothetical protein